MIKRVSALAIVLTGVFFAHNLLLAWVPAAQSGQWAPIQPDPEQAAATMLQARDGAEAGMYRAAHFLAGGENGLGALQPSLFQYTPPSNLAVFTNAGASSPVEAGGTRVGLSSSNVSPPVTLAYPTGAGVQAGVQTAFNTNVQGNLAAGTTSVNYGAYAELLSIKSLASSSLLCGGGGVNTLERWKVTGRGRVAGVQGADVEVSAIIDRPIVSCSPVAAYATDVLTDDGSHVSADIVDTFRHNWPNLKPGGLFVVDRAGVATAIDGLPAELASANFVLREPTTPKQVSNSVIFTPQERFAELRKAARWRDGGTGGKGWVKSLVIELLGRGRAAERPGAGREREELVVAERE